MTKVTTASGHTFDIPFASIPAFGVRPKQVEANEGGDLIEEMAAALRPLPKHIAQAFLNCFEALLSEAVVEFSDSSFVTASGARCGGISFSVPGVAELIAAAHAARRLDG